MKKPRREASRIADGKKLPLSVKDSMRPVIRSRRRQPILRANVASIFGDMLRQERKARGFSQEELALKASVERTFLSQIETGVRQPSLTYLWKLADALAIQPSKLIMLIERPIQSLIQQAQRALAGATDGR